MLRNFKPKFARLQRDADQKLNQAPGNQPGQLRQAPGSEQAPWAAASGQLKTEDSPGPRDFSQVEIPKTLASGGGGPPKDFRQRPFRQG